VDPSYSDPRGTSNYSDFAAFVLVGMSYQRELYIRFIKRAKMTYKDVIDEIFRIFTDRKFEDIKNMRIVLEVIGTKSLSFELLNEQKRRNTWLPITEIKTQPKSKEERIRGLAPFYEYGHIYHVKECPQIEELEQELLHFPVGRHDDVIDALANTLDALSPPNVKNTNEESRHTSRKRNFLYKPRSPITGV